METSQNFITVTDSAAIVGRTDKDFTDGVCSGYLAYYDQYVRQPLADLDVYAFLAQNIADSRGSAAFNAGYCTGG
jgi:hypothetical protein